MASPWKQADLDAVKAAVMDLATGKRTVTISYAGPPARSREYAQADLPQLEALLARINASVNGTPPFRLAAFSKGFDPPRGSGSGSSGGFDPVNE